MAFGKKAANNIQPLDLGLLARHCCDDPEMHVHDRRMEFKTAGQYPTNQEWLAAGVDRFPAKKETSHNLQKQIDELKEELLCRDLRIERDRLQKELGKANIWVKQP